MAAAGEADQVADERSVDALAALVRGNAGEVEELVDVLLLEGVNRGLVPAFGRELVPRLLQPVVHAQDTRWLVGNWHAHGDGLSINHLAMGCELRLRVR
jgi:hypothetical protein